ncbi:MAG: type II toxin-antitoxin system VapC family toxin [Deltaproteobacteria bacterium]|nr:type II toxin-antitoxin system VapC family toxin [Deltaproteobacteria bacterium]
MQTLKGLDSVYCDASFFVALFSKKDVKHKRALTLFKEIKENRITIYTCWFIISEAMAVLLYQYGYSESLTFNQSIDLYKIIDSTESQHYQAIALFNLFGKDRKISFVDALSHVLISGELKNVPALSFDRDFRAMGLTTIS